MQVRYQAALRPDRTWGMQDTLAPRRLASRGLVPRRESGAGGDSIPQALEQRVELGLHFVEQQLALGVREAELDLRHVLLALVEQPPPRAGDRETPRVQQLLDLQQQLHLVGT